MKAPAFSASLLVDVGEGQRLTIACTGGTAAELATNIAHAHAIASDRIGKWNEQVASVAEKAGDAAGARFAACVRALCLASGLEIPAEFAVKRPAPNGHDAQEGSAHADPPGQPDAATDP